MLYQHAVNHHQADLNIQYYMKIVKKHRDRLTRVIKEDVLIKVTDSSTLLNSRAAFLLLRVSRVVMERILG